jgi:iron-sulfur cluster assembly accessory protein
MSDTSVTKSPSGNRFPVRYDETVATVEHPLETGAPTPLVSLTPGAASKVKGLMAEEPDGDTLVLRVAIQGGGCSGFQYGLGFDSGSAEGDIELEFEGVRVVVDPFSAPYLRGATIDFLNTIEESGFKIDNPNAAASCGCGHSFTVAEGAEAPEAEHGCGSGCSH